MPRVQEHPDRPEGGRKYGAFQKVRQKETPLRYIHTGAVRSWVLTGGPL